MGFLCNANASDQGCYHLEIRDRGLFHHPPSDALARLNTGLPAAALDDAFRKLT